MARTTPTETIDQIEAIDLANVESRGNVRRLDRKEIAKGVRALFKALGIKGVSVTVPMYSMAQGIRVEVPEEKTFSEEKQGYALTARYHEAKSRLENILLAAFPDTENRSDSQCDHFDYVWMLR